MKEKIIMFVLGFLAGTIITIAIFLIARHNDMKHFKMVQGPQNIQIQGRENNSKNLEKKKEESKNSEKSNKKIEQKSDNSKKDVKEKEIQETNKN